MWLFGFTNKSWKESAHRTDGPDRYVFGDVTRGIYNKFPSKQTSLSKKRNSLVCTRKGRIIKKYLFFGDGDFSGSHKGHISMPTKKVLKSLATRGLTSLLDEYNTSKMCPCGKAELEDVCLHDNMPASNGIRCHKKTSGPECKCCIESILGKESMDRDVFLVQCGHKHVIVRNHHDIGV